MQDSPETVVLKLEGRIAGPSLQEMERAWNAVAANLSSRKLMLDLRGVTFIEADAEELFKQIYQQTGAEFQTSSLLTRYFAERTMIDTNTSEKSVKGSKHEKRCRTSKHD